MTKLIKTLTAVAAAGALSAAVLVTPTQPAQARGGAVAAGIIGGLAAGAIIGGAIANGQPHYYRRAPGYVAYDDYYAPSPYACPDGYWARRPLHDRWGNFVGWSRPRFICP